MIPRRCWKCEACDLVRATQRIVLASRPITSREVDLWNTVLLENPCAQTDTVDRKLKFRPVGQET